MVEFTNGYNLVDGNAFVLRNGKALVYPLEECEGHMEYSGVC
jgi:hypothetical protein